MYSSANVNHVTLIGRLTKDSRKISDEGLAFSVATDRRIKKGDEWVSQPTFVDCVYFGQDAQALSERLVKGQAVNVVGELESRNYEDKDGNNRQVLGVFSKNITLTEVVYSTPKQSTKTTVKTNATPVKSSSQNDKSNSKIQDDDEVPF